MDLKTFLSKRSITTTNAIYVSDIGIGIQDSIIIYIFVHLRNSVVFFCLLFIEFTQCHVKPVIVK